MYWYNRELGRVDLSFIERCSLAFIGGSHCILCLCFCLLKEGMFTYHATGIYSILIFHSK